jgi:hypothetical protein
MSSTKLIEAAVQFLETCRGIDWKLDGELFIEIIPRPPSDLRIAIDDGSEEAVLWCHHWHEHFADPDECLELFKKVIQSHSRVSAAMRGDDEHAWTLEISEDGDWQSYGTTGLIFFPFWKRRGKRVYEHHPLT